MVCLIVALTTSAAQAAEIGDIKVWRDDGRVFVTADMRIQASPELVFNALSDYDNFSKLSSRYKESRFIDPAANGVPRIYTVVEGCVLFFCRTVNRVAVLELTPHEQIVATVEPELSNLDYGREEWQLLSVDDGTQVLYQHEMDPEFWVPPIVGVWAIRRALEKDALKAAQRIEKLAQQQP